MTPPLWELVRNPERIDGLRREEAGPMLAALAAISLRLTAVLATGPTRYEREELIGADEVCRITGWRKERLYRGKHTLPFVVVRPGRRPMYSRKGLEEYLAGRPALVETGG